MIQPKPYLLSFAAPLHHEPHPSLQWIEISSTIQLPGFQLVGLPGREVTEARERVRAAIEASGFEFPRKRIVLNLSPAHIRKQGTGIDLAMALAVLFEDWNVQNTPDPNVATKQVHRIQGAAWAELGLDGRLKASGQTLRTLAAAVLSNLDFLLLGPENPDEIRTAIELLKSAHPEKKIPRIARFATLKETYSWLEARSWEHSIPDLEEKPRKSHSLSDCPSGLLPLPASLTRTLGVAAAGGHHLLLLGARGTGKSHALEWLQALMPKLDSKTHLEQRLLAELIPPSNLGPSESFTLKAEARAPIRRVGQQIRPAALIGRADINGIRPGEFTLAQGGLLVADEFLEWDRDSREAFREPLERGKISITRSWAQVELPARFTFAATGNLCPCGGWPAGILRQLRLDHPQLLSRLPECKCLPRDREKYLARLSGPIFDRIDLVVRTPPLLSSENENSDFPKKIQAAESQFKEMRDRVETIRNAMVKRYGQKTGSLSGEQLESWLGEHPDIASLPVLQNASSLRSRHRIARVAFALSLWDSPDGSERPHAGHFREASTYRAEAIGLG